MIGASGRCNDAGPAIGRNLDSKPRHRPASAMDKDRLALDRTVAQNGAGRRQRRNAKRGAGLEIDPVRECMNTAGFKRDVVGSRTEGPPPLPVADKDPGADKRRVRSGTNRLDNAGAIAVWYYAGKSHRP